MSPKHPHHDNSMWRGASVSTFLKAKKLRSRMTEVEKRLWEELKNNKLDGYKFRRQHPIQNYIADFYCHQLALIIEIDGEYHNTSEQGKKDEERTKILEFNEIKIIRFTNQEIQKDINKVLEKIRNFIQNKSAADPLTP